MKAFIIRTINEKLIGFAFLLHILVGTCIIRSIEPNQLFEVIFFDIGQGDASMFKTPNDRYVLIDTGGSFNIVPKVESFISDKKKVHYTFLSHRQNDHDGMVDQLMQYYDLEKVYVPKGYRSANSDNPVNFQELVAGNILKLDQDVFVHIVSPPERFSKYLKIDTNDLSLIMYVIYKDFILLYTGDGEIQDFRILDHEIPLVNVDVFKVPHHGSEGAIDFKGMEALSPLISVISVGKNSFGHPNLQVLETTSRYSMFLGITEELGDIHFFVTERGNVLFR